jgi:hypothetical protein
VGNVLRAAVSGCRDEDTAKRLFIIAGEAQKLTTNESENGGPHLD